jgi:hypothetical protein
MRAHSLTLNSPGVRAAKARWDRTGLRRKHKLSFNHLFSCFKDDHVRFSEIAMASGLSIQRVHQIYERYFRPLFELCGISSRRQARDPLWTTSIAAVIVQPDPLKFFCPT